MWSWLFSKSTKCFLLEHTPRARPPAPPTSGEGSRPSDYGASAAGRPTSAEELAEAEADAGEHYIGDGANITLLQCWQRLDYWRAALREREKRTRARVRAADGHRFAGGPPSVHSSEALTDEESHH